MEDDAKLKCYAFNVLRFIDYINSSWYHVGISMFKIMLAVLVPLAGVNYSINKPYVRVLSCRIVDSRHH